MLQEVNQNDANLQIDSKNGGQKDDKEKSCVCDQVHHFRKCLYIVSKNRKQG
jgi:hypothetical protein